MRRPPTSSYFIDPALMVQWIGEWADLHPEPGGKFALDIGKTPVRGEYVEIEPPQRVVFTWGVAGKDSLPPGSTTVELFHHDLPAEEFDSHLEGWTAILDRLVRLRT